MNLVGVLLVFVLGFLISIPSSMVGLAGGVITGLAGLGGGITDTSTMILLGVPPPIAAASSEFAMAVTNGAGVVAHGLLRNILIEFALPMTIGTVIGAQIGCSLAKRVRANTLRKALTIIAFFSGLRLVLSPLLATKVPAVSPAKLANVNF